MGQMMGSREDGDEMDDNHDDDDEMDDDPDDDMTEEGDPMMCDGTLKHQCVHDIDCEGQMKCCFSPCGGVCIKPGKCMILVILLSFQTERFKALRYINLYGIKIVIMVIECYEIFFK